MQKVKIQLKQISDITEFVKETSKIECDLDLNSGRYLIDAKSLMGIFTLGLDKQIDLIIHSDDEELKYKFDKWKVVQ